MKLLRACTRDASSADGTMLTVPEYNINATQREFAGHTGRVFDVDISNDGLCVTASEDGTAKI